MVAYANLYTGRLTLGPPAKPETAEGYVTRMVDYDDLAPFAGREPYGLDGAMLQSAFANGDEVVANFHEGELVGYSFQTRVWAPVTEQLGLSVPSGFVYAYKTWTHAAHRRRHLNAIRGYVRSVEAPMAHPERYVDYIESHNYPSLLHSYVHPARRAIRMGLIGYFTVLGKQIPFATPRARWLGVEFRRNGAAPRQYVD